MSKFYLGKNETWNERQNDVMKVKDYAVSLDVSAMTSQEIIEVSRTCKLPFDESHVRQGQKKMQTFY